MITTFLLLMLPATLLLGAHDVATKKLLAVAVMLAGVAITVLFG